MYGIEGFLIRRSTPPERAVLLVALIALMLGGGGVLLYLGWTADPEKAEAAADARSTGWTLIASGLALWAIYWICSAVIDWLLD